jgi:hypothetical protein
MCEERAVEAGYQLSASAVLEVSHQLVAKKGEENHSKPVTVLCGMQMMV